MLTRSECLSHDLDPFTGSGLHDSARAVDLVELFVAVRLRGWRHRQGLGTHSARPVAIHVEHSATFADEDVILLQHLAALHELLLDSRLLQDLLDRLGVLPVVDDDVCEYQDGQDNERSDDHVRGDVFPRDLHDPTSFCLYFRRFFGKLGKLEPEEICTI